MKSAFLAMYTVIGVDRIVRATGRGAGAIQVGVLEAPWARPYLFI